MVGLFPVKSALVTTHISQVLERAYFKSTDAVIFLCLIPFFFVSRESHVSAYEDRHTATKL